MFPLEDVAALRPAPFPAGPTPTFFLKKKEPGTKKEKDNYLKRKRENKWM
jgi:hypothetical protein